MTHTNSEWHESIGLNVVLVFRWKSFRIKSFWIGEILKESFGYFLEMMVTLNTFSAQILYAYTCSEQSRKCFFKLYTFESLWMAWIGMIIAIPLGMTKSSYGSNEYPFSSIHTLSKKGRGGYILKLSGIINGRFSINWWIHLVTFEILPCITIFRYSIFWMSS